MAAEPVSHTPVTYTSVYQIYVRGILFARADVELTVTDQQYQLSTLLRSSGLGVLFSDASALVKTSGKLNGEALEPESLRYSWTGEDSINFAQLDYVSGAPFEYKTNYKPKKVQKVVVPISIEDVGPGTRDPFLSLLVVQRPETGNAFCRTPMRLYDGRRLAKLSPENTEASSLPVALPSGAPPSATSAQINCRVRWEPVAGYPEKTYERAADMHPVNLEFVAIANSGFMAPREVSVVTRYGMVRITAVEPFSQSNTQVVPEKLELPPPDDDDEDEDW